jgi:hypothetical protein
MYEMEGPRFGLVAPTVRLLGWRAFRDLFTSANTGCEYWFPSL